MIDPIALLTAWAVPIAVLILVATVLAGFTTWARNYHTVPKNLVAVISGRKRKSEDGVLGYRMVTGGGFFKWPVIERVDYLALNVMNFAVEVVNVPCREGALVTVRAIANVKIQSDAGSLALAIERFLGKNESQIQAVAKENLESNLRAIVGTQTVEELIKERQKLMKQVMEEAHGDLSKLGLGLDLLNIQDVRDEKGYIEALGQTRTAEVKRDAQIGQAKANRDATVESAKADREAKEARALADTAISEATRAKDVIVSENAGKSQAAQARVAIVTQIAQAEETAKLNVATVAAEMARVKADTDLQALEKVRNEARLEATTIVDAKKQAEALVIIADGRQKAAERDGEAERIKQEKTGQGVQARQKAESEGRQALARAHQSELEATANGERAKLVAVAEGKRAELMAEADGIRARLNAEAEGALKKAEAFKQLDETGRLLLIMDASPSAIHAVGEAVKAAITPMAESVGDGLRSIESLRIVDFGNAANGSNRPLSQLANFPIETLSTFMEKAGAAGLGPLLTQAAAKLGLDLPESSSTAALPPARTNGKAHDDATQ